MSSIKEIQKNKIERKIKRKEKKKAKEESVRPLLFEQGIYSVLVKTCQKRVKVKNA